MGIYAQKAYNGLLNNCFNAGCIEFLNTKEGLSCSENSMVNLNDEILENFIKQEYTGEYL